MSQIAAIFANETVAPRRIEAMLQSLEQAPCDNSALWSAKNCAAAACTLHTTEESRTASQPHRSVDGKVAVVLDGYLANYEELKRTLIQRGADLRNPSDGELVLRAYEHWGEECAKHLDGEFAFIVLDCREDLIFCARDHQGLRPLYYTVENGEFLAASRVATLLEGMSEAPVPNHEFLAELAVADFASLEQTAWHGIFRVPHASSVTFRRGTKTTNKHYTLPTNIPRAYRSDEEYIASYLEMLGDVVSKASRSCYPVAFDVSGGLDSSSLYCLAHALDKKGRIQAPSIRGYTLAGEPGSDADEVEYARAAAQHVDGNLTEVPLFVPSLDWFAELTRKERDIATYPNGAQSVLAERQMVSDGARVLIAGTGGDQWLDGSSGFLEQDLRSLRFKSYWRNVQSEIGASGLGRALPSLIRRSALGLLPHRLRGAARRARNDLTGVYGEHLGYIADDLAKAIYARKAAFDRALPDDPAAITKQSAFDSAWSQFSHDLMSRQRAAQGIEGRHPMFSKQFIEFCSTMPEHFKRRDGVSRWVHRQALAGIVPDRILKRRSKAAFPVSLEQDRLAKALSGDWPDTMTQIIQRQQFEKVLGGASDDLANSNMQFELWGTFLVYDFLLDIAVQKV
ncbi:asparagine synthetase B family protein [Erythrobacter sp. MTPC3]|uniref:asparagine synthetase B family protein n=1 Tax=Erythrobacter sp. MTPC3 TaxID=3056564 RepID=UPI0036F19C5E